MSFAEAGKLQQLGLIPEPLYRTVALQRSPDFGRRAAASFAGPVRCGETRKHNGRAYTGLPVIFQCRQG